MAGNVAPQTDELLSVALSRSQQEVAQRSLGASMFVFRDAMLAAFLDAGLQRKDAKALAQKQHQVLTQELSDKAAQSILGSS